jgi:hypothetical protein
MTINRSRDRFPQEWIIMRTNRWTLLIVTGLLIVAVAAPALADGPELIGAGKCKMCHKAKTGDQWKIWTESAHAKAFETLATDEAKKIAADKGLGDPQQEEECLACHTTHGFVGRDVVAGKKYSDAEGVGCEACHGPGSEYKSKKVMEDREAALAAGLVLAKNAEHCQRCHNEKSPTYKPFDFEERWAEIAHPVPDKE